MASNNHRASQLLALPVPLIQPKAYGASVRRRCMTQDNVRWEATVLMDFHAQLVVAGLETLPSRHLHGKLDGHVGDPLCCIPPGFWACRIGDHMLGRIIH